MFVVVGTLDLSRPGPPWLLLIAIAAAVVWLLLVARVIGRAFWLRWRFGSDGTAVMNKKQKIALWAGSLTVCAMLICPPWVTELDPVTMTARATGFDNRVKQYHIHRPVYDFPALHFSLDLERLGAMVGGVVFLTGIAVALLANKRQARVPTP